MFDFIPPDIIADLFLAFHYIYITSPIWLPVAFGVSAFNSWLYYRRSQFWAKQGSVLLEIKLPKEITKSPVAMEIVLGSFFQSGGETTWIDRLVNGQTRAWFSLELVSVGGYVHFYIWMWPKFRSIIESQIYSQYPGIEIHEVEDYTLPYYYNPNKTGIWACEWKLDKSDAYPIKTYVDYGLDRDPKEEFKIDPMTAVIEFFGSLTEGQNAWMQIMIRAHKKEQIKKGTWFEKTDKWKDEAEEEKAKIVKQFRPEDKEKQSRQPTEGEKEIISALDRSISKIPFDCGIRSIYICDRDKFDPNLIGGITGSFRQFGSQNLNNFKPTGWFPWIDYPWQKWFGREDKFRKLVLEEYKLRRFFYSPWKGKYFYSKPFILNTEELATIYHFPGQVSATPTFGRVPSKKSEAPSNLPL